MLVDATDPDRHFPLDPAGIGSSLRAVQDEEVDASGLADLGVIPKEAPLCLPGELEQELATQ